MRSSSLPLALKTEDAYFNLKTLNQIAPKKGRTSKVTKIVKDDLETVAKYIDIQIREKESRYDINLLEKWTTQTDHTDNGIALFSGTAISNFLKEIPHLNYSSNAEIDEFVYHITKEAENTVRLEKNIPRIGEGWVSETKLFYEIKENFPDFTIWQHARPKWLGRQHLDIFIEDLNIAVEYQGLQHDEPVEFFGGEKAFVENQKRDARKRELCRKNQVTLIYVREGYNLDEILDVIKTPELDSIYEFPSNK